MIEFWLDYKAADYSLEWQRNKQKAQINPENIKHLFKSDINQTKICSRKFNYYKYGFLMITFRTNMGDFSIELDFDKAPITAANFLQYARDDFYTGTIFHRVINGFMVQGGGMDSNMRQKATRDSIENEADNGLKNEIGTLAMARTGEPHSASSQFFINVADNGFLNHSGKNMQGWGYAVFGKVVEGMDVIEAIKGTKTGSYAGHQDVPVDAIEITATEIGEAYADR
jgi:peptidyl-prolyl cis-trans isomerase B (cyclophilin B)